jgi:membrane protein required for colicin V production
LILFLLLAKALEKLVDLVGMGTLNHIFGGIFGLIKGILLGSVLLFIISGFDQKERLIKPKVKQESMIYGYASKVFPFMIKVFGGEIKSLHSN